MKRVLLGAALFGAVTAGEAAAAPLNPFSGEGGDGTGSVRLASALNSALLVVPDGAQSPLVTVGEGGKGKGKGKGKGRAAREGGEGGEGGRGTLAARDRDRLDDLRLRQSLAEDRALRRQLREERALSRRLAEERSLRRSFAEDRALRRQLDEDRLLRRELAEERQRRLERERQRELLGALPRMLFP